MDLLRRYANLNVGNVGETPGRKSLRIQRSTRNIALQAYLLSAGVYRRGSPVSWTSTKKRLSMKYMRDALFCDAQPHFDPYGYPPLPARELTGPHGFPFPFGDIVEVLAAPLGNHLTLDEHVSTLLAPGLRH